MKTQEKPFLKSMALNALALMSRIFRSERCAHISQKVTLWKSCTRNMRETEREREIEISTVYY